ncbi:uncharacterized protein LOC127277422 [Leptopilina boulardi]|uniref:uncharacterized protein LOC127277422 n=1 Tax=Leptopilina boulardi TaxID=63433 RepID=UPI0021F61BE5|nr:uncharacterized protein LOC127277422 [Leptopilina boulardi]
MAVECLKNVETIVGPYDADIKRIYKHILPTIKYVSSWYHFRQIIKEIWARNFLTNDLNGIFSAAFVIPLFPANFLLDAYREFTNLAEKSEELKGFLNEVLVVITNLASEISIDIEDQKKYLNVFEICEKQFDVVKRSKSLGNLFGCSRDIS